MTTYLEQGQELTLEQLHGPFEKALREGHLVPVCFASSETPACRVPTAPRARRALPEPDRGQPAALSRKGQAAAPVEVTSDPSRHLLAHVFKILTNPFVGKLGYLRVHQGTLKVGAQAFVGDAKRPHPREPPLPGPGQGARGGRRRCRATSWPCRRSRTSSSMRSSTTRTTRTTTTSARSICRPRWSVRRSPPSEANDRSSPTRSIASSPDPCVRIEHVSRETVLYGLGDLHLRVLIEHMKERAGVSFKTSPPSIPYRETLTRTAEGHHRHKKQTGGAGQFGEVFLRVEPLARGAGFEFNDEVVAVHPRAVHPGRREGRPPGDRRGRRRGLPDLRRARHRHRR